MTQDKDNRKQLNFRVNPEVLELYNKKRNAMGITNSEYLDYLVKLDNSNIASLEQNEAYKDIEATAEKLGVPVDAFIIDACKTAIARIETVRVFSADKKIEQYVNDTIEANEKAQNWYEKTEITQRKIAEATGCNRPAISKYMTLHEARLDAHHKVCEIEPDHNRKVYVYQNKQNKKG